MLIFFSKNFFNLFKKFPITIALDQLGKFGELISME